MSFFGLTDPYIWGAYVACIVCTVICIYIGLRNKDGGEEDDQ